MGGTVVQLPNLGEKEFHIAFGTCAIEDEILVVKEGNLKNVELVSGIYMSGFLADGWKTWPGLTASRSFAVASTMCKKGGIKKMSDLLAKLEVELHGAIKADSRRENITAVEFVDDDSQIKLRVSFV